MKSTAWISEAMFSKLHFIIPWHSGSIILIHGHWYGLSSDTICKLHGMMENKENTFVYRKCQKVWLKHFQYCGLCQNLYTNISTASIGLAFSFHLQHFHTSAVWDFQIPTIQRHDLSLECRDQKSPKFSVRNPIGEKTGWAHAWCRNLQFRSKNVTTQTRW